MAIDDTRATLPDDVPQSSRGSWPDFMTEPGAHPDVVRVGVLPATPRAAKALALVADTPAGDLAELDAPRVLALQGLGDLERLMVATGGRAVIVIDEQGHPVGTVTPTDLLTARRNARADTTVAQVMQLGAFEVTESTPLERVVEMIAAQGAESVAVVDGSRRMIGSIRARDVVRFLMACPARSLP